MYKVKFLFELKDGSVITNDKIYDEEYMNAAETDDEYKERLGLIVCFEKIPMLQDYQEWVNKLWCFHLQFMKFNGKSINQQLEDVRTMIID